MGDYFQHWLDVGKSIANPPKIFNVNWFNTDDEGHFLWPGFGDNMRVLMWMLGRVDGKVDADETCIGYVPKPEDLNTEGIESECPPETVKKLLTVDKALWKTEIEGYQGVLCQDR